MSVRMASMRSLSIGSFFRGRRSGLKGPPAVVSVGDGRVAGEHRPQYRRVPPLHGERDIAPVGLTVPASGAVTAVPAVRVLLQELAGARRLGVLEVPQAADAG